MHSAREKTISYSSFFVTIALSLILPGPSGQSQSSHDKQTPTVTELNPDADRDGLEAVLYWAQLRRDAAAQHYSDHGLSRSPSPGFWGGEIVYQIMVDRFANGNPSNDMSLVSEAQKTAASHGYRGLAEYHHGGDLAGIKKRLPYLVNLGITSLWLTPIFKNASGSYHGYCTSDFTAIDPNFGTTQEFVNLVAEAHRLGIRIILDLVVNHICDEKTQYQTPHTQAEHLECARDFKNKDWLGQPSYSVNQKNLVFSSEFFPPLKLNHFYSRCGANSLQEMEGEGPETIYGDFTPSMLDIDTRNYDFQKIFTSLMEYWIAVADVDGFRLDAVKHITPDFTAYFSTKIRDYARSLGKDNFYIVAEIAGNPSTVAQHLGRMNPAANTQSLRERLKGPLEIPDSRPLIQHASEHLAFPFPGANGVFDFAHSGIARDVLSNQRSSQILESYFSKSEYRHTLTTQGNPRLNFTVLEIHDWERFNTYTPLDPFKSRLALAYLATAEGIPVIYYGMEQGFNGHCQKDSISPQIDQQDIDHHCFKSVGPSRHPQFRQDMFMGSMYRLGSSIPEINSLAAIGPQPAKTQPTAQDPYLRTDHLIYRTSRRLNHLRQSCFALRYGSTVWRWSSPQTHDFFAFSRIDGDREALVVVNTNFQALPIPELNVLHSGMDYVDSEGGSLVGAPTGINKIGFSGQMIEGNQVKVFLPRNNPKTWDSDLQSLLCLDSSATTGTTRKIPAIP
jgi:glycosidase